MQEKIQIVCVVIIILFSFSSVSAQQEEKGGVPPAIVVVSDVRSGMIAPENEFVGTVYYQEVSDVAAEVSGRVDSVKFEEGQRIKSGHILVQLDADLLEKKIQATTASREQVLADLENSLLELKRVENLRREELVPESRYDEQRFKVKGLEKRDVSLKAEVERLELELKKKAVQAPFDGVIVKKHIDRGEWVSEGSSVATIAKDDVVDIVVDVPQNVLRNVTKGMDVEIRAGSSVMNGKVIALIPHGDISTRTFPVKIRARNTQSLMESMEARISLPIGKKVETLVMSRDAVVPVFGINAVFIVQDGKAKMIPVEVVGYESATIGVSAEGLKEGMKVVVKGNERLKDGQDVLIQQ